MRLSGFLSSRPTELDRQERDSHQGEAEQSVPLPAGSLSLLCLLSTLAIFAPSQPQAHLLTVFYIFSAHLRHLGTIIIEGFKCTINNMEKQAIYFMYTHTVRETQRVMNTDAHIHRGQQRIRYSALLFSYSILLSCNPGDSPTANKP